MVAHESGESDRDKALRIKEERHSKVESSEEEELGSSGAAASAAPSGKEEGGKGKEEETEPLPATSAAEPAANTTPAVVETAETTSAVEGTAETKEEEEKTTKEKEGGEEEKPEQDPIVEPEAEATDPVARPSSSGRVIADFQTSPEGVKTGWEVRGIHAKYTPAKVDPKAPWRVKKNIWGQVKKHPEPQTGFRLRSKTSLQYRRLKDLVRLEKKKGVITEDLRRRIKEFGKGRTPQEIKEEREEQKVRNQEKRAKKRKTSEAADPAEEEEVEEEEESVSHPSPVRQPRTPDGPPPAKRPQTRDTQRGRAVWGRALELNLRIIALANERAQRLTIENWKLESPFQVRKFAADELCEQRNLKGTVALAEACSSCDERRQAQLPVVKDYIKRRELKGPAALGSSAKSKAAPAVSLTPGPKVKAKSKAGPKGKAKPSAAPKVAAEAKATTVGRRPEELTRTTVEVRGVPKPSDP